MKPRARKSQYVKASATAKKALYLAQRADHAERREFDSEYLTSPDSTGYVAGISRVGQGDRVDNREGNQIRPVSISFKNKATIHASATSTTIRYIIFQWKSGIPVLTDTTSILESANTNSFKALAKKYQSKILYDTTVSLNSVNKPEITWQKTIKVSNWVSFEGSGADPATNGLYMLVLSDEATNTPSINFQHRLAFFA